MKNGNFDSLIATSVSGVGNRATSKSKEATQKSNLCQCPILASNSVFFSGRVFHSHTHGQRHKKQNSWATIHKERRRNDGLWHGQEGNEYRKENGYVIHVDNTPCPNGGRRDRVFFRNMFFLNVRPSSSSRRVRVQTFCLLGEHSESIWMDIPGRMVTG